MQFGFTFRELFQERAGVVSLVSLIALWMTACEKRPPTSASPAASPPGKVVLAVHWMGKARMAQDTNAAYQMGIWDLPETVRLQEQTLDKLARALPARLGVPGEAASNSLTGIIRPLLDDLVQAESFAEVRVAADQPAEFALAVNLTAERLALWQTNLAALTQVMSGSNAATTRQLRSVQFSVAGDWMVVGLGTKAGADLTGLMSRLSATNQTARDTKEPWIVVDADLGWWMRSNAVLSGRNLPSVHLALAGEGQAVRMRGELTFPQPLRLKLDPWNVPTNLIHEPLISFTAVRGVNRVVESLGVGRELQSNNVPEQVFAWALRGSPFEYYQAAVLPDPSASFSTLAGEIMTNLNPILTSNGWSPAMLLPGSSGMVWSGMPFFEPFIRPYVDESGRFIFGGFYPPSRGSQPIPPELLAQIAPESNLLYYDWEITQERGIGWLYLAQTLRMIFQMSQLEAESAGLRWMLAVSPKLGNSVTALNLAAPSQLTISRTSSIGFTGMELQALVDWLEAPDFPSGFNTFSVAAKRSTKRQSSSSQSGATQGTKKTDSVVP